MVHALKFTEADFRGREFATHPKDLRNLIDVLCITQPDAIENIHRAYLEAGADIIETNTFGATSVALADFALEGKVRDLNLAAVKLARRAADDYSKRNPNKPRFVAGSIGPTNKQLSIAGNVNDPGYRGATFDQMVATYYEQVERAGRRGRRYSAGRNGVRYAGAQGLPVRHREIFRRSQRPRPGDGVIHRVQRWPHAFSTNHRGVLGFAGPRQLAERGHQLCALGPEQVRPYLEELSAIAPVYVSCYPNAGLPNAFGGFDETPQSMARLLGEFARQWLAEYRRRLLRHDAAAHQGDRRSGGRRPAAQTPARRTPDPAEWAGAADDPARDELHHDRRADERDRLEEVRPADQGRKVRRGFKRGARPGRKRRQRARRQLGRRPARRRSGDDQVLEPCSPPSRKFPACRSWSTAPNGRSSRRA